MRRNDGKKKQEMFTNALRGKQVPVLTLDSKWYRLLDEVGRDEVRNLEEQLNHLLKRQGKLNTETKDIKKLKKKLMSEIVAMADESDSNGNRKKEKQIAEHKRLVEECNEKLESYQDELIDIPHEIDRINIQLMLITMECCYDIMQENTDAIQEITEWVTKIRIELKKNLIRKQEMEQRNHDIYSYMHDIFGADVIDIFDMRYNPEEHHPKKKDRDQAGSKEKVREESVQTASKGPILVQIPSGRESDQTSEQVKAKPQERTEKEPAQDQTEKEMPQERAEREPIRERAEKGSESAEKEVSLAQEQVEEKSVEESEASSSEI